MATGTEWYQVKLFSRDGGGNFFQNVINYLVQEDPVGDFFTNAKELADAFHTHVVNPMKAIVSQDTQFDAVYCRKIGPGGVSGNTYTRAEGVNGTINQPTMTGVTALNFNLFTTHVKQHGHIYVGGLPNDMFLDDILSAAYNVPIAAFITAIITQMTWGAMGEANLAVHSKKLNNMETVASIEVATKSANLKRRVTPFG
jgi:hypothetical protein